MTSAFSTSQHMRRNRTTGAASWPLVRSAAKHQAHLELDASYLHPLAISWGRRPVGGPARSFSPICSLGPRRLQSPGPQPHRIENNVKIIWY